MIRVRLVGRRHRAVGSQPYPICGTWSVPTTDTQALSRIWQGFRQIIRISLSHGGALFKGLRLLQPLRSVPLALCGWLVCRCSLLPPIYY